MHEACQCNSPNVVELLIRSGACVHAEDNVSVTLLEVRNEIKMRLQEGNSSLTFASSRMVLEQLIRFGADINAVSKVSTFK